MSSSTKFDKRKSEANNLGSTEAQLLGSPDIPRRSKSIISNDKGFDTEFGHAKEELRARTEFNRRLLNLEITLLAATVAVLAANNANLFVSPYLLQVSCSVVLWVAVAFSVENYSNNFFIIKAAQFQQFVLNEKYGLQNGAPVFDWETFVASERQHSPHRANRLMFVADAPFILNVVMSVLALASYCHSVWLVHVSHQRMFLVPLLLALTGCLALGFAYWSHFQPLSVLNALVTRRASDRFAERYRLTTRG